MSLLPLPSKADPYIGPTQWKTNHATGCMLLSECTEGVVRIKSYEDLVQTFPGTDLLRYQEEVAQLLEVIDAVGVEIYIADQKYFVPRTAGIYGTKVNKLFLNRDFMQLPGQMVKTLRHEGFHVAQDCMAGGLENSYLGVIHTDEEVPNWWKELASELYPPNAQPWEQEAKWMGDVEYGTVKALEACKAGPMWEHMEPTPMTKEWLTIKGYIK